MCNCSPTLAPSQSADGVAGMAHPVVAASLAVPEPTVVVPMAEGVESASSGTAEVAGNDNGSRSTVSGTEPGPGKRSENKKYQRKRDITTPVPLLPNSEDRGHH
ncbi:hypothetical protein HOY80DRAFT_1043317 [Tuber brumale]|nr:hypothetical protein HOY80DRAFT_1043317 [Tuber brumale]